MNKYHNNKSHGFDSQKERRRFQELQLMQRAGMISGLKRQVRFELIPAQYRNGKCVERKTEYVADFTYYEKGRYIVEDCKGYRTDVYRIKRKLMLWRHDIQIRET